ncbi:MAG: GNAT family N-acyltransferase [Pseudomonadota bacterium]
MLPSPMRLQKGRYVARLAASEEELAAVQALRREVFRKGQGSDEDRFDAHSAHVLVEEAHSGTVLCCFRMMTFASGVDMQSGYAAQFYDLSAFEAVKGPMVEIGRFCVADGAHDPDILRVAWGAVTRHVDQLGVKLLFGCSSFGGASPRKHQETLIYLKDRHLAQGRCVPGFKASEIFPFAAEYAAREANRRAALRGMPSLLRTYLAMGGWVSDHAVIDRDLDTLHVFTGVEIAAIPPARAKALRAVAG